MKMNNYEGKAFLATVRGEDFAHAGEEEAIDIAFAGLGCQPDWKLLDAGCGRGGTADYVHRHGWGQVIGIDIEERSIEYAQEKYPECHFQVCDICRAGETFPAAFDLIYSFNAMYAVSDKGAAIAALRKSAKRHGRLCIFDYVTYKPDVPLPEVILSNQPATEDEFLTYLLEAGWQCDDRKNLDAEYMRWYGDFLSRFDARAVTATYAPEMIEAVRKKYADLLSSIETGVLGGLLLTATAV